MRVKWRTSQIGRNHLLGESSLGKNLLERRVIQGPDERYQNVVTEKKKFIFQHFCSESALVKVQRQQNEPHTLMKFMPLKTVEGNFYQWNPLSSQFCFPTLSSCTHVL